MRKITNVDVELRKNEEDRISFYLKQYDDVVMNIAVYDGLAPVNMEGQTIYVAIDKADGTKVLQKEDITIKSNIINVDLSTQAVTAEGVCKLEILIEDEYGISTTATTNFLVSKTIGASITEIITSSDDIHHLKLIEDFILNSNLSIEDINTNLDAIRDRIKEIEVDIEKGYKEVLDNISIAEEEAIEGVTICKETALDEIDMKTKESIGEIDTVKKEVIDIADDAVEKANEVIREAGIAKGEVQELMATIEASKEEVDTMGQVQVANINAAGTTAINNIEEAKEDALEAIKDRASLVVEDATVEITRVKDTAIEDAKVQVVKEKDKAIVEATEAINSEKDKAVEDATTAIEGVKAETEEEMATAKDKIVKEAYTAVEAIENTRNEAIGAVELVKDNAIAEMNTTKDEAVGIVNATKDSTIEEITAKKDAIIDEISKIETGSVEGVEEAVKKAEVRLQELTVQCNWDVKETATVEKEGIEAHTREQKTELSNVTSEHIQRINNAGASIVETVEGLEANIEDGLNSIERTVTEGKTEIRDLSATEINKIKTVGQEITDAVRDLEINTVDNIERIVKAGESQRNSIESLANAERAEISKVAQEKREQITTAGDDKLEEINSILGVSKGEVEDLLNTTRQEIQTHRTDIATRVNLGKEEIGKLKDNSISEMTATKDNLIEEILGAEVELKENFEELANGYTAKISDLGDLKVENLNKMIDSINNLQDKVESRLELSDKKVENMNNTISNVDAKVAEIKPVLDTLNEVKNVCTSLIAENTKAGENIEELEFLHIEADTRIVELRRLIEEAKKYEEVVKRWIDSNMDGNINSEEVIEALKVLDTRLTDLELQVGKYYSKEEIDEKIETVEGSIEDLSRDIEENYAKIEYVDNEIDKLSEINSKTITNVEIRAEFFDYPENEDAIARYKVIDKDGYSHAIEILKEDKLAYYSKYHDDYARLYWYSTAKTDVVLHYKYVNGVWSQQNKSTSSTIDIKINKPIDANVIESPREIEDSDKTENVFPMRELSNEIVMDYNVAVDTVYYRVNHTEAVLNAPTDSIAGYLKNDFIGNDIVQEVIDYKTSRAYTRTRSELGWTNWMSTAIDNVIGDVDLDNYYTKEEVYNKAEVDDLVPSFNGTIGKSEKPVVFATCPEPDTPYVGVIEAFNVYNKRYSKIYIHELLDGYTDSIKCIGLSSSAYNIQMSSSTVKSYTAYYKTETSDWTKNTSATFYNYFNVRTLEEAKKLVYSTTHKLVYNDSTFIEPTGDDGLINSYNGAIKVGTYKVSHAEAIEGCAVEKCEGVLLVNKAEDRIVQTLVESGGKTYTRYYQGGWSNWSGADTIGDISFAIKTDFTKENEYYPYFRFKPAQASEYPYRLIVTTSTKYGRIIYSKQDLTGYLRYDTVTKKLVWSEGYENLEMLHYYVSDITSAPSYSYSLMSWSTTTTATQYFNYTVKDWYSHNFDILDTEGNVYRKSEEFDTSKVVVDFNLATEYDKYNVDINVDEEVANKPVNERLKGFLVVDKCGSMTKQELITVDNNVYRRIAIGATWSEWKSI